MSTAELLKLSVLYPEDLLTLLKFSFIFPRSLARISRENYKEYTPVIDIYTYFCICNRYETGQLQIASTKRCLFQM